MLNHSSRYLGKDEHNSSSTMPASLNLACMILYCLLAASNPASAAIYACKTPNGTTFQDNPCKLVTASANGTVKKKLFIKSPVDIEKSWLEKPPGASYTAWCDRNGCECGPYDRVFDAGMVLAVADALYLDGSWHRFENYALQLAQEQHNGSKKIEIEAALTEAACNIRMSQTIIRKFTGRALKKLRTSKREAEDRGYDTPEACALEDMDACEIYSKFELYQRMMQDIKALKLPRDASYTALLD
ncbi:MAG: DUF4124 domain-containing protein [Granulosicoccaceae bacterium]